MKNCRPTLIPRDRHILIALASIAQHNGEAPASLPAIAKKSNISCSYLEKYFVLLRMRGIVKSARGRGGGYTLARSADEITVSEILRAISNTAERVEEMEGTGSLSHPQIDILIEKSAEIMHAMLEKVTLADIAGGRVDGHPFLENILERVIGQPKFEHKM